MIRWFLRIALAMLTLHAYTAQAAEPAFHEGQGYTKLAVAQPVSPSGKIVVTEFFWYNCPHCAAFDPSFEAWIKRQPADVVVERVPVAFAPQFVAQQKLYYALKALGKVDALQGAIFKAIHQQNIPLMTEQQMANWLAGHGIPKAQFENAFNAFGVQLETKRADQMVQDYQINGVPTLAVQGTYTLTPGMPETPDSDALLQAVDMLVARVRAQGVH